MKPEYIVVKDHRIKIDEIISYKPAGAVSIDMCVGKLDFMFTFNSTKFRDYCLKQLDAAVLKGGEFYIIEGEKL